MAIFRRNKGRVTTWKTIKNPHKLLQQRLLLSNKAVKHMKIKPCEWLALTKEERLAAINNAIKKVGILKR